jgi:hypothetical protein
MLKQRAMQQVGGNAITHGGGAGTTNTGDKDKQPSETELK